MKISDKIIFSLVVIFITISWCLYLFDSWIVAIVATIVVFILIRTAYAYFVIRRKSTKCMNAFEMCKSFALLGIEAASEHIYKILPPGMPIERIGQFILANYKDKKIIIMNNYKFSNTSEDDIAKAYRFAKEKEISTIYLLSRFTDRKIMVFAASLPVDFKFIDKRTVRKYLIDRNSLPPAFTSEKKKKPPIDYKEIFAIALDSRRIKYYFFTGTVLFLMSFFTPLKLYYLIISTIPLFLAGLSALKSVREK